MARNKRYSELIKLPTFEERFQYLLLDGSVGETTFGGHRGVNQNFYRSHEWRCLRSQIIIRDNGCDLAVPDRPVGGKILIHHMNPIEMDDFRYLTNYLMNPEYLITISFDTHNALHYGNEERILKDYIPRRPNDTCPWR